MEVMPLLQKHFMTGGARMSNAFVNTPICCPSRTEFFSGRLYHNIGPPNDPGKCMHVNTDNVGKKTTGLFGLMVQSGYEVGKSRFLLFALEHFPETALLRCFWQGDERQWQGA